MSEQGFTIKELTELRKGLSSDAVKTRSESGRKVSYVEGYYVIGKANEIFDWEWSGEIVTHDLVFEDRLYKDDQNRAEEDPQGNWTCCYKCVYRVKVRGIWREDVGYGDGNHPKRGGAHELAMKEATTDARKRCWMTFGDQFGLTLYDKDERNRNIAQPAPAAEVIRPLSESAYKEYLTVCEFTKDEKARMLDRLKTAKHSPLSFLAECRHDGLTTTEAIFERLDKEYPPTQTEASVEAQRPLAEAVGT